MDRRYPGHKDVDVALMSPMSFGFQLHCKSVGIPSRKDEDLLGFRGVICNQILRLVFQIISLKIVNLCRESDKLSGQTKHFILFYSVSFFVVYYGNSVLRLIKFFNKQIVIIFMLLSAN